MAKSALRLQARELRSLGISVVSIAKQLNISRGTVSLWVRDIILSVEQLEKLRGNSIKGAEYGRIKGSLVLKQRRLDKIKQYKVEGQKKLAQLTENELLVSGLAIYWGEGSKKKRRVEFCNSDPEMVKFLLRWLQVCFNVPKEDIICWVGINEVHIGREPEVLKYWSKLLGIPLYSFRKTSYKKVKSKKIYENFNQHFGTLYLTVSKSADLYYKIAGLISGLTYGRVA